MQPTAAASKGSTRALYLSCDGSLSGGLSSALVPDCRRSIMPRLRLSFFATSSAYDGCEAVFLRRSRSLLGCVWVRNDAVFMHSCGTRVSTGSTSSDQGFAATVLALLVSYSTLAKNAAAPRI